MLRNLPLLLITLLLFSLLPSTQASTSLCLSCATTFNGYCVACNAGGCAPYSTLDTGTNQCNCNDMYYLAQTTAGLPYCDRCHTGCLTCSGPEATSCISCSANFTLDSATSSCIPPNTANDVTLQNLYSFLGFNLQSNWGWETTSSTFLYGGASTRTCGSETFAGFIRDKYLQATFSSLQNHYQVRVMFAHYILTNSLSGQNIQINAGVTANMAIATSLSGSNNPGFSCAGRSNTIKTMVDQSIAHTASSLTLRISTTDTAGNNYLWGIKEVIVIIKLCNSECSACDGYYADNCTTCSDSNKIATYTGYSGICKCWGSGGDAGLMYEETSANTCVRFCPSVPSQTYGQNVTRTCVSQCPNDTYAYSDLYRCWADCPTVSVISSQLLFRDKIYWRCVPNCPAEAPYGNADDRICYSTCPNTTNTAGYASDYFAVDGLYKRCVSVCPYNSTFQLFGYQAQCIPLCPDGTWGDPITKLCLSDCTSTSTHPYKDNSSGQNICVQNCTNPDWFRDNSTWSCVPACPSPKFGQTNRQCVTKCNNGRFGIPFDNRKCIDFCPEGWWGQPDADVCVNTPLDCKTTNNRYADNYTRTCVFATSCSLGYFAQNNTQSCVPECIKASAADNITGASVGEPTSRLCQSVCNGSLYADYVAGLCVSQCVTNDTYRDDYAATGKTCVLECTNSAATKWRDNNTMSCVADCNDTGVANFVRDSTTWMCVYQCPPNYYADFVTTTNPICRSVCLTDTYGDNSTGTGLCVERCSEYPPKFGDWTGGMNICVDVCSVNLYGDELGNRVCTDYCPAGYFAQNDTTRLCVPKCKPGTYGQNRWCNTNPFNCTANTFANDANNLCDGCSAVQATWGDPTTKRCVTQCPLNTVASEPITYYADISLRQCVLTCSSSYNTGNPTSYSTALWGNNNTRTCVFVCSDLNSYVEPQANNPYRVCVSRCHPSPVLHYANNETKVCGPSLDCGLNHYGENSTQTCITHCPAGTFGFVSVAAKICIDICPLAYYGQNSTGINYCVLACPSVPPLYADPTTKLCVSDCPSPYYADPQTRTCVLMCPFTPIMSYAYEPNRTCLEQCPTGYFGNTTLETIAGLPPNTNMGRCVTPSSQCGVNRWADTYLHLCVTLCSGPNPVSLYGHWPDCVEQCPSTYYANTYNGVRICVQLCPPGTSGTAAPNLYGDPSTITCVASCITPLTWADYQTRLCEPVCSALPTPTYSQNFGFTCVTSMNCPTSPSMTFGDNNTRSCQSNCTLGKYGDPTTRFCVTQCPNSAATGNSMYYADTSTGQYICVVICPILPKLFGQNTTNMCVVECPQPLYGDQTGNRSCVGTCPLISSVVHFAQNTSRICVTTCENGTWGYTASRQCVENPFHCMTQWADSTTNLCVTTCPATASSFGDPTTKLCVTLCPNTYFADYSTRTCVQTCPSNIEEQGYFGNNETRICEQRCAPQNNSLTYADPQTNNRFCVSLCSQTPHQAFRDASTARCVPICPTFPDLYGQTATFTCTSSCAVNTYADTNTRMCVASCPANHFKHLNPNLCVTICPPDGNVSLYGDTNSGFCQSTCTNGWYRYDTLSICVSSCSTYSLLAYNMTCVKLCPLGYYADATTGICASACTGSTFGQNTTTTCLGTCITGYADSNLCKAICPAGKYGQNKVCVTSCQVSGNTASNLTHTCVSNCTNTTYSQGGQCVTSCTSGTYADPFTNQCSSSCTNSWYGDPSTNKCVTQCPPNYYKDATGYCVTACSGLKYADNITWQCVTKCSTGYWGDSNLCLTICPSGKFGYLPDRICYTIANRPNSLYFADNNTQTWVQVCPFSPLTFGDRTIKYCISNCYGSNLNDPSTRQCETSCQNASYFADLTTNQCVMVCPAGYFANSNNNLCQAVCSTGYAYQLERTCVATCPAPYSGWNNATASADVCVLRCPSNFFSYNRVCYSACTVAGYYADNATNQCLTSCTESFASDDAKRCVVSCAGYSTYPIADNSTNRCVSICPSDPDYYVQNNVCVFHCASNTFADPTVGKRDCTSLCTTGLFSDPVSGRCNASCPLGYWAQNTTNDCVQVCLVGSYADNVTGKCVVNCPPPTYADPTTRRCVKTCPNGYFGEANLTCVLKCTLPLYANPLNRVCEATCTAFDQLFAQNTTASCVHNCSIVANSYADRNNNICVSNCTRSNQYMLDGEGICTNLCPLGLFMENSTKRCQATCTTGFAEPTTRYCVARCFGNVQTFGYNLVCHYTCLNSTHDLYADNSTNLCVSPCPSNPEYFSDPLTGNCVLFCPDGYFAQNDTRTCATSCLVGYADNLTRKCVAVCPTVLEMTYGQPNSHVCVRICPANMYADNVTQECVNSNNCSGSNSAWSDPISKYCVARCPSEPLYFGLNSTTSCVSRCPSPLFGDYQSQTCIPTCTTATNGEYRFADPVSQTCVFLCPINSSLYGDTAISGNFSCVTTCSGSQLRDNSTQRCVALCPSTPSYWADTVGKDCVYICPSTYFASREADRLCVPDCGVYFTYGDTIQRICTSVCPFNHYADNSSYLCKTQCPSSPDYYADNTTGRCVFNCPETAAGDRTYADPTSRQCVTKCPSGYFAVNSTRRCDTGCPANEYEDPIIRICVAQCTVRPHYYKHTNLKCLFDCPTAPMAYRHDVNHSCVYVDGSGNTGCPGVYWANPIDSLCTTLCPDGYFADQVLHLCVTACPANYYADDFDRLCKTACSSTPEEYRLQVSGVRTCVQFCPSPYYADNSTYNCVLNCPATPTVMYKYDLERKCVINCIPPYYSYLPDRTCRTGCPNGYYAQDSSRSCQTSCLTPYFADNTTNRCILLCPSSPAMFGHNNVCIEYCPLNFFADNSTRMCVSTCPTQPVTFSQNTTRTCVIDCPSIPSSFADNTTMRCVADCPVGTFAQVTTRTCVLHCPGNLNTYADTTTDACQATCPAPYFASDLSKQCVTLCPFTPVKTYALNTSGRICSQSCPSGLFGHNTTRSCENTCFESTMSYRDTVLNMCVSTCSYGWFARNDTRECVLNCPAGSYADNHTRICLAACSGVLQLYADDSTWTCVSQCPSGSYGSNQNWTCISNCPPQVFGYKLDISNTCIEQCPSPYFAYVPTRTCVLNCGAGLYGDSATRICNDCNPDCPTCLSLTTCLSCTSNLYLSFGVCLGTCPTGTFANNASMTCVYPISCPAGYFGNSDTKECSTTCPTKQYANISTKMCTACPQTCSACVNDTICTSCITSAAFSTVTSECYSWCNSSLQYSYNGSCFSSCPDGSYLDYTNVYCQACNSLCLTCFGAATNCTSCGNTYLYNFTCITQCPTNYYVNNGTCQVCNANVTACQSPLTFTTTTRTQNYQSVIYLQFSEPVSVTGDPNSLVTVNLNLNRRVLQSNMVNNGLSYTAEVMADGTIRIVLNPEISLSNPSFTISINNPNQITTASGSTLSSLEATVTDIVLNAYPPGTTSDAPMVVAGTVLAIIMLLIVAAIFICSPVPAYHSLQAFQMISFYAFVTDLPPNFFYFMRELRLTRMAFLPNVFSGVYKAPTGYVAAIPERPIEIDGQFSFAVNAGSFLFIIFIYLVVAFILYLSSRKFNTNRPMRQILEKIYNTRVRWGIVWDFLWMFGLNIMVIGFLQFKYTADSGQIGLAVFCLLIFISFPCLGFFYRVKYYNSQDQSQVDNFSLISQGLKSGRYQYVPWLYFLRRIIFAAIIAGTIDGNSRTQSALLMTLSILMLLTLLILRPYQQKLRNFMHIAHQVGLTALAVGIVFYRNYLDAQEPVGTKITCGDILTIGMILHLSIAIIWSLFRTYYFFKEAHEEFKKTEFYMLYLDEKYDQNLEKQIQQLNDETGTVEGVEVTHGGTSQYTEQLMDDDDQIIKLKIRRRRKLKKDNNALEKELKPKRPVRRNEGDYVKISGDNQSQYQLEPHKYNLKREPEPEFERVIIENDEKALAPEIDSVYDGKKQDWVELKNNSEVVSDNKLSEKVSPRDDNIFAPVQIPEEPFPLAEMEEISSVSNKEEGISKDEGQNIRESLSQMHSQLPIKEENQYKVPEPLEAPPVPHPTEKSQPDDEQIFPEVQFEPEEVKVEPRVEEPEIEEEPEVKPEEAKAEEPEDEWQPISNWEQMKSEQPFKEDERPPSQESGNRDNFVINLDEQVEKQEKKAKEKEENPAWNMEIEDLMNEEDKEKEKPKKNLLLFDPEDFE